MNFHDCNTQRGAENTNNRTNHKTIIDKCAEIVKNSTSNSGIEAAVKCDYDAISVTITHKGAFLGNTRSLIYKFLMLFGTSRSSINLPRSQVASSASSSIFSTPNSSSMHLGPNFGCEMQIGDCPVKIAAPPSCQDAMVHNTNKYGFPLKPATNKGLCFDPFVAKNPPSYGVLSNAILDSCWVGQDFFLHIANIGMRLPIEDLTEVFTSIGILRQAGFDVHVAQLDIAFSVDIPKNNLFNLSCVRKEHTNNLPSQVTKGHTLEVYPLHTLNLHREKEQNGTIRSITKDWANESKTIDICTSRNISDTVRVILDMYETADNSGKDGITMAIASLYSVKEYSTVHHANGSEKTTVPVKDVFKMMNLHKLTISQIKSIISFIWKGSLQGVQYSQNHNVADRFELSIRPTHDDSLRNEGHLTDFLAHVLFLTGDFFNTYEIKKTLISPSLVQSKLHTLINYISPLLRVRESLKFNVTHPGHQMADMLKAYVYMMMTTAGMAGSYRTKFLNIWAKDIQRIDPGNQFLNHLQGNNFLHPPTIITSNISPAEFDTELLTQILLPYFNTNTTSDLVEYIKSFNGEKTLPLCYHSLSLREKLSLMCRLDTEIIPALSSHGSVLSDEENMASCEEDGIIVSEIEFPQPDNRYIDTDTEIDQSLLAIHQPTHENLLFGQKCRAIQALICLCPFYDNQVTHSLIQNHIAFFILKCHFNKCTLPGEITALTEIDRTSAKIFKNIVNQSHTQMSTTELRIVCQNLSVKVCGTNFDRETYIRSLCLHYSFPCPGVLFPWQIISDEDEQVSKLNTLLKETLSRDIVIPHGNCNHATHVILFRSLENTSFSIVHPELIVNMGILPSLFVGKHSDDDPICFDPYALTSNMLKIPQPHNHGRGLRQYIHSFLANGNFNSSLLDPDGKVSHSFIGLHTLGSVEDAHSIRFQEANNIQELASYLKFEPVVILHLSSLIFQVDIVFYHLESNMTHIFAYHPKSNKSIKYSYSRIDVLPVFIAHAMSQVDELTFKHIHNPTTPDLYSSYAEKSEITRLLNQKRVSNHLQPIPNFSKHPHGKYKYKPSLFRCLEQCMKETNHMCVSDFSDNAKDPFKLGLTITSIMSTISGQDRNSITHTLFHENITELFHNIDDSNIREKIKDLHPCRHLATALFVWKFKTPVIILENISGKKRTRYYYFSRWSKKVKCVTTENLFIYTNINNVIYLKASQSAKKNKITWGYYIPKFISNPSQYISSLAQPLSQPNKSFTDFAIAEMEKLGVPLTNMTDTPVTSEFIFQMSNITIKIIHNTTQSSLEIEECTLIILYPHSSSNGRWMIQSVSQSASISNITDLEIKKIQSQVSTTHIRNIDALGTTYSNTIFNVEHIKAPGQESDQIYIILLIVFLAAKRYPNPTHLLNQVEELYNKDDLSQSAKRWAISYCLGNINPPMWLVQYQNRFITSDTI